MSLIDGSPRRSKDTKRTVPQRKRSLQRPRLTIKGLGKESKKTQKSVPRTGPRHVCSPWQEGDGLRSPSEVRSREERQRHHEKALRGEKIEDLRDPTAGRLEDKMDEVSAEGDASKSEVTEMADAVILETGFSALRRYKNKITRGCRARNREAQQGRKAGEIRCLREKEACRGPG